jgi:hypothetical protein
MFYLPIRLLIGLRDLNKDMMFLKLDFAKAYGKVSWSFFCTRMEKLGMDASFINMVRFLFQEVETLIYLNGKLLPNNYLLINYAPSPC